MYSMTSCNYFITLMRTYICTLQSEIIDHLIILNFISTDLNTYFDFGTVQKNTTKTIFPQVSRVVSRAWEEEE